jgi:hypothetical protein
MEPEDIRGALNQLRGEGGEPVGVPLGMTIVDAEVLPFHIAEVTQPLLEGGQARRGTLLGAGVQHPELGDLAPQLRHGHDRCQGHDKGDEEGKGTMRHGNLLYARIGGDILRAAC